MKIPINNKEVEKKRKGVGCTEVCESGVGGRSKGGENGHCQRQEQCLEDRHLRRL